MAPALALGSGMVGVVPIAYPCSPVHRQQRWSCGLSFGSASASASGGASAKRIGAERRAVVRAAGEGVPQTEVEGGDVLPADQWPDTFGFLNYEDLHAHYEPVLFKPEAQPATPLADVMSKTLYTAFPEQTLAEVDKFFKEISGLPVVDEEFKVIGVLSKKDKSKATNGETSKVKEVMSTPAITLSADMTVQDAVVLMLKNKIHRIPIVDPEGHAIGIVSRTDIFTALEAPSNST